MFTDHSNALRVSRGRRLARIASTALLLALTCVVVPNLAGANNPGDPLFCQPQEGTTFLIVNGGSGVFTVDADCYSNNMANDTTTTITTSQGGTLTLVATPTAGNYTYTPPTPTFTGLDTFSIAVTTVWNGAGGTGSAGGTARPGGAATLNITLNVISATTTLEEAGDASVLLPVPAGSVSGCSAPGNEGLARISHRARLADKVGNETDFAKSRLIAMARIAA